MKKHIKRLKYSSIGLIFGALSFLLFSAPQIAHAATADNWTGTDCNTTTNNCNWSDVNNWSAGIPTSGADDALTFDNNLIGASTGGDPTDDIPGLTVDSIVFINDSTHGAVQVDLNSSLTINTAITQESSVATTTDILATSVSGTPQVTTLGGDVTVTTNGSGGFQLGDGTGDNSIALNANGLNFVNGDSTTNVIDLDTVLTGNGTVNYNAGYSSFIVNGANTYSGTTNVNASSNWISNDGTTSNNPFGTSSINIASNGSVLFQFAGNTTINNVITVAGTTGTSNITSIQFDCLNNACSNASTFTVPHITLNGNTRFGTITPNLTIDLAGIVANGNCLEYLGDGTNSNNPYDSTQFINGPAGCAVDGSTSGTGSSVATPKVPKKPDTGSALISSNAIITLVITTATAAGMVAIALRSKVFAKK